MTHERNEWVFEEGRRAFLEGRTLSSNPYQRTSSSWQDWFNGWEFQRANPRVPLDQGMYVQQDEDESEVIDYGDDKEVPEDTPSIESADLWGTGEGRHHGII